MASELAEFKKGCYNHFRDELKKYKDAMIIGFDAKHVVMGIATTPTELRDLLKLKGLNAVVINHPDIFMVGYDFKKKSQFVRTDDSVLGRLYTKTIDKQYKEIFKNAKSKQLVTQENHELIQRIEDFCMRYQIPHSKSSGDRAGDNTNIIVINLMMGNIKIEITEELTYIQLHETYLIVHDMYHDIETSKYMHIMSKLLFVPELEVQRLFMPNVR
ncbi:hypothetical protein [Bacillus toyonensis]|uniref:hypothetical protein n=1 Tax=Bacillus toyonensis TaxID=155322 RepID=UPI000BF5AADD|nr:hypothetical protein [Bacillus toyonensis]PGF05152.1 hypothetical protein COM61_01640 [Bacillus toyonensis]